MPKHTSCSPTELWDCLLNMDPDHFNDGFPDIEMLRDCFQKYSDLQASKTARQAFQSALEYWSSEQMQEFMRLVTENQLSSSLTSEEIRESLRRTYTIIFES